MNEVFKVILSLSCSGALLIVLFRLFRPMIQAQLSKRWQYYIWLVVVARLLLPFAPEVNLMGTLYEQIGNGIFQAESTLPAQPNGGAAQPTTPGSANTPADQPQDQTAEGERPAMSRGTSSTVQSQVKAVAAVVLQYLWLLWLITALVLFIRKVTIYQSFVKYIRAGCVEVEDIGLLERFGGLVAQSGVKAAVDLSVNPLISSPLLIGFFRPRIVLPTTELSDSDFQFTILHELTHFKRLDMFYKWLVQAAVCIHWFNPLAWLMKREVERACELACDEAVIRSLDAAGRRAYGDTLLNAIGAGGHYKESVAAVTLCESKQLLSERLAVISSFHRPSGFVRACSIVLAGAVCLGAVSVGAYSAPAPGTKPKNIGNLTLITKEYTMEELIAAEAYTISVQTVSDEITVLQGGDTVKFEYYAATPEEYTLNQTIGSLPVEDREELDEWFREIGIPNALFLARGQVGTQTTGESRSITITVPKEFPLDHLSLVNSSGNIRIDGCSIPAVSIETQTGSIEILGGTISRGLKLQTNSGDALIDGTVLPQKDTGKIELDTRTGFIRLRPLDSPLNYRVEIDYGDEANVMINNEYAGMVEWLEEYAVHNPDGSTAYPAEAVIRINQFTINDDGTSIIYFTSPRGTLQLLGE